MPQTGSMVVAPNVPEPRWPDGYVTALREAGAQEKTIPYCIAWVRDFFARNHGRRRRDLGRLEIEAFLTELAARPGIGNRQVQQARDALEVYYERFRGIVLEPRSDVPKPHVTPPPAMRAKTPCPGAAAAVASTPTPNDAPNDEAWYAGHCEIVNCDQGAMDSSEPVSPNQVSPPPAAQSSGAVNWTALEARVRDCLRVGHYAYRTEQTYLAWIRRFVMYHQWRKPSALEAKDVHAFLRHLAMDEQVASSTQNQALNAVVFLYREVVKKEIGDFSDFPRARRGLRLPVVASRDEVKAVIDRLQGREQLIARLLYGTGMRINECLGMRVQDVYFDQNRIVAHGKGTEKRFLRAFPGHGFGPWIDTLLLTRAAWPDLSNHSLGALCDHHGLTSAIRAIVPNKSWHDALFDATASLVLLAHLIETLELAGRPVDILLQPDTSAWHKLQRGG